MFSVSKLIHRNTLLLIFLGIVLLMGNMNGFITVVTIWSLLVIILLPIYKYIDLQGVVLLLFSLLYILFGGINGFVSSFHQVVLYLIPIVFYLFGSYIYKYISSEKTFLGLICLMLFLYAFEVYITIIGEVISTGSMVNTSRLFYFHGDQSRQLTATLVGLNVSVGLVGFPMFIISKKYNLLRWLYLLLGLLSLITTMWLVNRSGLAILFLSLCAILVYYYKKQRVKLIFLFVVIVTIYSFLISTGIIGSDIINAYSERNSADLLTGGDRPRRWVEALHYLFEYPFGWAENDGKTTYYVHNMWLDIAKVAGIFPFVALLLATLISLKQHIKLLKYENSLIVALFIGMYVCLFSSCFLEPLYGGPHFYIFVMLWGMSNSYLNINKHEGTIYNRSIS